MKKIIKLVSFLLLLCFINFANANVDFLVKPDSAGEEAFSDKLNNIKVGEKLNFQAMSTLSGVTRTGSINFPSGFEYNNFSTGSSTCSFQKISRTNSSFQYSYSSLSTCVMDLNLDYTVTNTGEKTINYLEDSSIKANVKVGVTSQNTLIKAETMGNDNGYLTGILLYFSTGGLNNFDNNGLTIGGYTGALSSTGTNTAILSIKQNTFKSGDRPTINHTGNIFDNTASITNFQVEDKAKPILLKVNNQNILGSQNISISTGSINFEFSEKLHPSSTFIFKEGNNTIAGTYLINNEKLTFTPSSNLTVGTYTLAPQNNATDYSSNSNIIGDINISLIVADNEAPKGLSIGTSTGISINNGANSTNNNSVQLNLIATDNVGVTQMWISNDSGFSTGNWENYSTSKNNWNLLTTGIKNVYVKFKDSTGNISPVYSDSIEYNLSTSSLTFYNIESMYTNSGTITLSGSFSSGNNSWNSFSGQVNNSGSFIINGVNNKWNHTFNLETNTRNVIKIWTGAVNYTGATIKNSITIINPIPTCSTVANGTITGIYPTCDFTCNVGYNKVGSSCQLKNKNINNYSTTYNSSNYDFANFILYYNSPQTNTSTNEVNKNNGKFKLSQTFTLGSDGITVTYNNQNEVVQSCNSGYQKSGNSCVAISSGGSSGGGGGGSYTPTCSSSNLVCSEYLGKYIWQRKSGVSCSSSKIGQTCDISENKVEDKKDEIIKNTEISKKEEELKEKLSDYISENNIIIENNTITKKITTDYLKDLLPSRFEKIVNDYSKKIPEGNIEYFITFDNELKDKYNDLLLNYSNLFTNINELLNKNPNTEEIRADAIEAITNYKKLVADLKQPEKKYVEIVTINNDIVYKTKNNKISELLGKIEKLILNKYKLLLSSNTITKENYDKYLKIYNDFILYYTINKTFDDKKALKEAIIKIKEVIKIYKMKIVENKVLEEKTEIKENIKKVRDEYALNKDLKYGDYNTDVTSLQSILKHFGYFPFNPSGYFGNSTLEYLKNFTKEKLNITFSGVLDQNLRKLILDLEL